MSVHVPLESRLSAFFPPFLLRFFFCLFRLFRRFSFRSVLKQLRCALTDWSVLIHDRQVASEPNLKIHATWRRSLLNSAPAARRRHVEDEDAYLRAAPITIYRAALLISVTSQLD